MPWHVRGKPNVTVQPHTSPAKGTDAPESALPSIFDDHLRHAGRPPRSTSGGRSRRQTATFAFRLTDAERAALDARAAAEERDAAVVIRRALRRYLASPVN